MLNRPTRDHRRRKFHNVRNLKSANFADLDCRSARARTRRYRKRLHAGIVTAIVELDGDVITMLLRSHWLTEEESVDRRAIGRAISTMLAASAKNRDAIGLQIFRDA